MSEKSKIIFFHVVPFFKRKNPTVFLVYIHSFIIVRKHEKIKQLFDQIKIKRDKNVSFQFLLLLKEESKGVLRFKRFHPSKKDIDNESKKEKAKMTI